MAKTSDLLTGLRLQLLEHVPDAVKRLQELCASPDKKLAAQCRESLRRRGLPVPPEGSVP